MSLLASKRSSGLHAHVGPAVVPSPRSLLKARTINPKIIFGALKTPNKSRIRCGHTCRRRSLAAAKPNTIKSFAFEKFQPHILRLGLETKARSRLEYFRHLTSTCKPELKHALSNQPGHLTSARFDGAALNRSEGRGRILCASKQVHIP